MTARQPGPVATDPLVAALADALGVEAGAGARDPAAAVRPSRSHGVLAVDVAPARWADAAAAARDVLGASLFDHLTAVDEPPDALDVVLHVWAPATRVHLRLRTRLDRAAPRVASVAAVYRGAAWAERETAEMFGVVFAGHPAPGPLLLAPSHEGHPLRKDSVLAARVVTPWPGSAEPGVPRRRPVLPPGVPPPGTWGLPPADRP